MVKATLTEAPEAYRRMPDILRAAQRETFGSRSETLSPDEFNLTLEDAGFVQGVPEAPQEKAEAEGAEAPASPSATVAICRALNA